MPSSDTPPISANPPAESPFPPPAFEKGWIVVLKQGDGSWVIEGWLQAGPLPFYFLRSNDSDEEIDVRWLRAKQSGNSGLERWRCYLYTWASQEELQDAEPAQH